MSDHLWNTDREQRYVVQHEALYGLLGPFDTEEEAEEFAASVPYSAEQARSWRSRRIWEVLALNAPGAVLAEGQHITVTVDGREVQLDDTRYGAHDLLVAFGADSATHSLYRMRSSKPTEIAVVHGARSEVQVREGDVFSAHPHEKGRRP